MPRPAATFPQVLNLVRIGRLKRWHEPEEDACKHREQQREKKHPGTDINLVEPWGIRGSEANDRIFQYETVTRAKTPEIRDKSTLSVKSWPIRRALLAPITNRIPISRRRPEERARRRLAMFTQAMSSTNPTAPSRRNNSVRCGPTRSSFNGTTRTPHLAAEGYSVGYSRLSSDT